ncbi:hypothetical protein BU15DRAFT_67286 [Melanogaster broomeanus]|nr:hypothetical protein BU15DRAFT_67286 [Melanogaster broomeanus]
MGFRRRRKRGHARVTSDDKDWTVLGDSYGVARALCSDSAWVDPHGASNGSYLSQGGILFSLLPYSCAATNLKQLINALELAAAGKDANSTGLGAYPGLWELSDIPSWSAWEEVDTATTRNCWCKASIINSSAPTNLSVPVSVLIHADEPLQVNLDPIVQAEKDVIMSLDDLEATGALQCSNRMDIKELLNPAEERQDLFEATDQGIYNVVMEAKAGRKRRQWLEVVTRWMTRMNQSSQQVQ